MAIFSFSTATPQEKAEIISQQIRTLFGNVSEYLNTLNPDGLVFPAKAGNGGRALRLNAGGTDLEYKKVATLDNSSLANKDLIYYDNASGDFTRLAIGANGTALQVSGGAYIFAALPAGALTVTSIQTTGFTATDGVFYPCDTTSAGFTITLPLTPTAGQRVGIKDISGAAGTNAITVARNGSLIMNLAEDLTISTAYRGAYLVYNTVRGWLLI